MASHAEARPAHPRRRTAGARTGALHDVLRSGSSATRRWLRAEIGAEVVMERRPGEHPAPTGQPDLDQSLDRWSSALRHRRAAVIARRHLTITLAPAIAAEVALRALGGRLVGPWLAAIPAIVLLDAAIAWRRPVPRPLVAQMLDRCLALHDLLATAAEIPVRPEAPGLSLLVLDEATLAARESHATVRLRSAGSRRDGVWLGLSLVALAALLAIPAGGTHHGAAGRRRSAASAGSAAGGHRAATTRSRAAAQLRRAQGAAGPRPPAIPRAPLAVTGTGAGQQKSAGFSPYGHGANALSAKQLAKAGIAPAPTSPTQSLGTLALGESGSGSGNGGNGANASKGSSGAAGGKSASGAPPAGAATQGGSAASSGGTLSAAGGKSAARAGGTGNQQSTGRGGASTGSSPPGGSSAGTAAGSNALRNGLIPAIGTGTLGLPLQAGYAPDATGHSQSGEGVSQTPNGGGSGGRSAHAENGGESSLSSRLSVIPPSFNATPALDEGVLSNYFGTSNQLTAGSW